jgi:hypothetical protein
VISLESKYVVPRREGRETVVSSETETAIWGQIAILSRYQSFYLRAG